MDLAELSISQLTTAAGLSRRAVRFYVQQGLLPPPEGRGRASHYRPEHLARLKNILELQQSGHSLDAIRRILDGEPVMIEPSSNRRPARPRMSAEIWTRLRLMDGLELHFNAARFSPDPANLIQLREVIRQVFTSSGNAPGPDSFGDNVTSKQEPT